MLPSLNYMRHLIISVLVLFASATFASAQKVYDGCADVKGISRETKCDSTKFVSIFGKPDEYYKFGKPEDGDDMSETYYLGDNCFVFQNSGILTYFSMKDNRLPVLTNYIKGGIRVGDRFSIFDNFEYGKPVFKDSLEDGRVVYSLWADSYDPIYLSVKDGVIKTIVYLSIP